MKTCHVCGAYVEDGALSCPECGATIVKHSEGFSLKVETPAKKKGNPMGTTVSTGSGLTNILRGEDSDYVDNDDYISGSIPISLSRTEIDEDYSTKKKKGVGGVIFKFILVIALIAGIYYLVTNVFMKQEGAADADQVIEIYVDAVNAQDQDKLLQIIPPYITANLDYSEDMLNEMKNVHIDEFEIVSRTDYTGSEVTSLQDSIKIQTGKTANLKSACKVKLRLRGTVKDNAGNTVPKYAELEMDLIEIRGRLYIHVNTYSNPDFTY